MGRDLNAFYSDKALWHREKLQAIARGGMPTPVQVTVYPTARCNRDCQFCIMREMREEYRTHDIPESTLERLVDEWNALGVQCLHISGGGEPGLYPHMWQVCKFNGRKVLSTNGTNPGIWHYFHRVRVSLNAATAETYRRVAQVPESWFHETVEAIRTANHADIGIGFVLDVDNACDLPQIPQLLDKTGAAWIHIRPASYPRHSVQDIAVRKVVAAKAAWLQTLSQDPRVHTVTEKFAGYWGQHPYSACRATPLHAVVLPNASLSVCQDVFHTWGDLNQQSFAEAWQSQEHRDALAKITIATCPRCVLCRANEIIERVAINNEPMMELI